MTERISNLPGWGLKSANNLVKAVVKVKQNGVSLTRYIYSLGIRHCGLVTSEILASTFQSSEKFLEALRASKSDQSIFESLTERDNVKGVGPKLISSLILFSNDDEQLDAAETLASAINVIHHQTQEKHIMKAVDGRVIVFTGKLKAMSRQTAQKLAMDMGARSTPSNLSRSTDLVVKGEGGGKKVSEAIKMGLKIINELEWCEIVQKYEHMSKKLS